MKRTLLLAALTLFTAAPALAHEQNSTGGAGSGESRREARLTSKLGLDAAAKANIERTFAKYRSQFVTLRREAQTTRQALEEELALPKPDQGRLSALADQLQGNRQQMRAVRQQRAVELKEQLTPEQYARMMLRHRSFHQRRAER